MANRSGRDGMFLKASARESLLRQFARFEKRKRRTAAIVADVTDDRHLEATRMKDGCRVCKKDNDHSNMLLCEKCSAEYHFYCIGLKTVPTEDWFCDICRPKLDLDVEGDGLELKVAAMPPLFTSRFGEVVWAQGGPGYGWWPCYIYDPRMTVGGARDLAKKHLGKKHLVYFFQCLEAPFAALPDSKLSEWYTGLTENYHLGKAARHSGKNRAAQFAEALKIANLELGKPIEHRMDWNHPEPSRATLHAQPLLSPNHRERQREQRKRKREGSNSPMELATAGEDPYDDGEIVVSKAQIRPSVRTNLVAALEAHNSAVTDEDDELYLRVMQGRPPANVGFVRLGSRSFSTFRDARRR
ncbi:PWWP domain [Fragilaria crotonensis]|nr:PWWP domain [Fragilaria crotonensis]